MNMDRDEAWRRLREAEQGGRPIGPVKVTGPNSLLTPGTKDRTLELAPIAELDNWHQLQELVMQVAEEPGVNAINGDLPGMVDYLLNHDWTIPRIVRWLKFKAAGPLPWVVTDTKVEAGEQTPILGRFATQELGAKFIETLPDYDTGRYGLDGPSSDSQEVIPTFTPAEADEHRCPCGNMTHLTGFFAVLPDGTFVEPTEGDGWDGHLYGCPDCFRQFRIEEEDKSGGPLAPSLWDQFSSLVNELARATQAVSMFWDAHMPGDFYTPETGYPYDQSLDEVSAAVWTWADGVAGDADVANGRA